MESRVTTNRPSVTYTFSMPTSSSWSSVERRSGMSHAAFVNEYQRPGRPVVFTDLTRDWPALGKFSPGYFRKQCGNRNVPIGSRTYKLGEFLDLLETSSSE